MAPTPLSADEPRRTGPTLGLTLLLGALTALTALAIDMSLPALPQLQQAFSADVKNVQLTLSLFLLGFGISQFVCGPLSDHYGRRPVTLAGLVLYVLAGVACAFATSLPALVAFRLLQGAGASVGPILSRAIVRDLFEPRESSAILSHITQVMVIAPMIAPLMGAWLLTWFGWQAIFIALAFFGALVCFLCWRRLPETMPRKTGHLRIGRALASYRAVLTHLPTLRYILAICFAGAGLFAYVSASPFVLMEVFGVKREHFGFYFACPALALLAGAAANRALLARHEPGVLLRRGINLLLAGGALIFVMTATRAGGAAGVLVPMMIYMFGIALVMPNATAAALARHGSIAGSASSAIGGVQTLFSALSAFLVGAFYDGNAWSLAIAVAVSAACTALICRCEPKARKVPLEDQPPPLPL